MKLKDLKPGDIFKLTDIIDEEVTYYQGKNKTPKSKKISIKLEEWHAVLRGEYPSLYLYTILFKKSDVVDGVQKSDLPDGEIRTCEIPHSTFDSEPPTSVERITGKELRMIMGDGQIDFKLVANRGKNV